MVDIYIPIWAIAIIGVTAYLLIGLVMAKIAYAFDKSSVEMETLLVFCWLPLAITIGVLFPFLVLTLIFEKPIIFLIGLGQKDNDD